jgi:hypothetical protein
MQKTLLIFGKGNAKLDGFISTFSLPSGHTCPGANSCLAKTVGKVIADNRVISMPSALKMCPSQVKYSVQDGPENQFRCFTACDEARYPAVRLARWNNFNLLRACKTQDDMVNLIVGSLPTNKKIRAIRVHVAGDYFSQMYFDAWMEVARRNPQMTFYSYTKSLNYWVARLGTIPANFQLNASVGGKFDSLIETHGLKSAKVVFSVAEAESLGLALDHDDSHAYTPGPSFALLLHGTQPAGSRAAVAWSSLKKQGIGGYGNQKEARVSVKA